MCDKNTQKISKPPDDLKEAPRTATHEDSQRTELVQANASNAQRTINTNTTNQTGDIYVPKSLKAHCESKDSSQPTTEEDKQTMEQISGSNTQHPLNLPVDQEVQSSVAPGSKTSENVFQKTLKVFGEPKGQRSSKGPQATTSQHPSGKQAQSPKPKRFSMRHFASPSKKPKPTKPSGFKNTSKLSKPPDELKEAPRAATEEESRTTKLVQANASNTQFTTNTNTTNQTGDVYVPKSLKPPCESQDSSQPTAQEDKQTMEQPSGKNTHHSLNLTVDSEEQSYVAPGSETSENVFQKKLKAFGETKGQRSFKGPGVTTSLNPKSPKLLRYNRRHFASPLKKPKPTKPAGVKNTPKLSKPPEELKETPRKATPEDRQTTELVQSNASNTQCTINSDTTNQTDDINVSESLKPPCESKDSLQPTTQDDKQTMEQQSGSNSQHPLNLAVDPEVQSSVAPASETSENVFQKTLKMFGEAKSQRSSKFAHELKGQRSVVPKKGKFSGKALDPVTNLKDEKPLKPADKSKVLDAKSKTDEIGHTCAETPREISVEIAGVSIEGEASEDISEKSKENVQKLACESKNNMPRVSDSNKLEQPLKSAVEEVIHPSSTQPVELVSIHTKGKSSKTSGEKSIQNALEQASKSKDQISLASESSGLGQSLESTIEDVIQTISQVHPSSKKPLESGGVLNERKSSILTDDKCSHNELEPSSKSKNQTTSFSKSVELEQTLQSTDDDTTQPSNQNQPSIEKPLELSGDSDGIKEQKILSEDNDNKMPEHHGDFDANSQKTSTKEPNDKMAAKEAAEGSWFKMPQPLTHLKLQRPKLASKPMGLRNPIRSSEGSNQKVPMSLRGVPLELKHIPKGVHSPKASDAEGIQQTTEPANKSDFEKPAVSQSRELNASLQPASKISINPGIKVSSEPKHPPKPLKQSNVSKWLEQHKLKSNDGPHKQLESQSYSKSERPLKLACRLKGEEPLEQASGDISPKDLKPQSEPQKPTTKPMPLTLLSDSMMSEQLEPTSEESSSSPSITSAELTKQILPIEATGSSDQSPANCPNGDEDLKKLDPCSSIDVEPSRESTDENETTVLDYDDQNTTLPEPQDKTNPTLVSEAIDAESSLQPTSEDAIQTLPDPTPSQEDHKPQQLEIECGAQPVIKITIEDFSTEMPPESPTEIDSLEPLKIDIDWKDPEPQPLPSTSEGSPIKSQQELPSEHFIDARDPEPSITSVDDVIKRMIEISNRGKKKMSPKHATDLDDTDEVKLTSEDVYTTPPESPIKVLTELSGASEVESSSKQSGYDLSQSALESPTQITPLKPLQWTSESNGLETLKPSGEGECQMPEALSKDQETSSPSDGRKKKKKSKHKRGAKGKTASKPASTWTSVPSPQSTLTGRCPGVGTSVFSAGAIPVSSGGPSSGIGRHTGSGPGLYQAPDSPPRISRRITARRRTSPLASPCLPGDSSSRFQYLGPMGVPRSPVLGSSGPPPVKRSPFLGLQRGLRTKRAYSNVFAIFSQPEIMEFKVYVCPSFVIPSKLLLLFYFASFCFIFGITVF